MNFKWTEEKSQQLRELKANGVSFANAAREIGCSRNAAIGKAHRLGLEAPPKSVVISSGQPRIRKEKKPTILRQIKATVKLKTIEPEPIESKGIQFLDLQSNNCRYPYDNGLFCGRPKEQKSYCAYHGALCYQSSDRW